VRLFVDPAHWTTALHIRSGDAGAVSPALRLSFSRAFGFICEFI